MKGIILANSGSPSSPTPDDVERYLREYLMDDRIRQLPRPFWKRLLHKHILPKRKHSSAKRYQFIWTEQGAPLVVNQQRLADKVQKLFDEDESFAGTIIVRSAMSYGSPTLEEVLCEMRELRVDEIVLLPMYPQSAYSTTRAVSDAFRRTQAKINWHPASIIIDNYHNDPGYIAAIVKSIQSTGFDPETDDRLLLSFHAIPLKDEKAGDTYRDQIAESARLIAEGLGVDTDRVTVAFQSVFGPNEKSWTGPLSRDVLQSWHDDNFRVMFACPGFSIDCLETLYDAPHVMVPALEGEEAVPVVDRADEDIQATCNTSGRFVWIPTLNTSYEHASLIKGVLSRYLRH